MIAYLIIKKLLILEVMNKKRVLM